MAARRRNGRGGWRPGSGRPRLVQRPRQLNVLLEEDLYDQVAHLADDERMSVAGYVRQVIEQHVQSHLRRHPR